MRLILLFAFFVLACSSDRQINDIQKIEVYNVIKSQELSWNKGDLVGFMQGYWKDSAMQFVSKRGARFGWQATLQAYQKGYPTKEKMGNLSFTNLQFTSLSSGMAQVLGNWQVIQNRADTLQGNFSLIFKQFKEGPKIINDHTW